MKMDKNTEWRMGEGCIQLALVILTVGSVGRECNNSVLDNFKCNMKHLSRILKLCRLKRFEEPILRPASAHKPILTMAFAINRFCRVHRMQV